MSYPKQFAKAGSRVLSGEAFLLAHMVAAERRLSNAGARLTLGKSLCRFSIVSIILSCRA
jgi:hypothetical protein